MTEARRGWGPWTFVLLLAITGSVTSCVYFNTYYNAEKYFERAEKARAAAEAHGEAARNARSRTQYVTLYDQAVRKASVVLEKFPESDLVDDAMFIAGRSLYWQRDYQYAMRSFRDLELNFPESEYFDRARLWRGRTLMALAQLADSRALFAALVREGGPQGDQAGMRLGELAANEGDRRGEINEYRKTLDLFPDTRLAARLWLRIGEANIDLGGPSRLDSAMAAFDRALLASPSDSVQYRASLNRGRVQQLQGQADAALQTYQELLDKGSFRAWEGETRILIGRHYLGRGLLTEALAQFERVRDDFPQTVVSAMALYETGLVYLQKHGQRERGQEYFEAVSQEKRGSLADSLAKVMLKTCVELDGLVEQAWIADSTAAAILIAAADTVMADATTVGVMVADTTDTALVGTTAVDTAVTGTAMTDTTVTADSSSAVPVISASSRIAKKPAVKLPPALQGFVVAVDSAGRWQPLFPRPKSRDEAMQTSGGKGRARRPAKGLTGKTTLEEQLFTIAELYRDRLVLSDSAAVVYEHIVDRFPASAQRPRALYSLAWIHFELRSDPPVARPYLEQLVDQYGATAHANAARRLLDLPLERTAEAQATEIYGDIERLQEEQPDRPDLWLSRLDALASDFPATITAARAAFVAARVTENEIGDSVAAEARYDSVASRFPQTEFADLVDRRRRSRKDGMVAKMERELKTMGQAVPQEERLLLIAVEPDSLDSTSMSKKYLGFAMRAHRRGQFDEAERLYYRSLDEQRGRNGNVHAGLGDVSWRQGYFEEAVGHLRTAVKERATSLLPQYRLFQYHVQQSQEDSANHYLRQVTRRDQDNPDARAAVDRFPTIASAEPESIDLDLLEVLELEPTDGNLSLPASVLGIVEPPLVRTGAAAQYPEGASDSASVVVDILVTQEGRPDSVRLYQGSEPFASEAIRAVEAYRFYAAKARREKPMDVWVEVVIPFRPPAPVAIAPIDTAGTGPATEVRTE